VPVHGQKGAGAGAIPRLLGAAPGAPLLRLTILMVLAMAASICRVVHGLTRDEVPLRAAVTLLCVMELLRILPLGRS